MQFIGSVSIRGKKTLYEIETALIFILSVAFQDNISKITQNNYGAIKLLFFYFSLFLPSYCSSNFSIPNVVTLSLFASFLIGSWLLFCVASNIVIVLPTF